MGAGTVALDAAKAGAQWVAKNPGKAAVATGAAGGLVVGGAYVAGEAADKVGNAALKVAVAFAIGYGTVVYLKNR